MSYGAEVSERKLYVLAGATASGKSAVAQHIAEQTGACVLSADSMLIYRGMDIGTAKPDQAARGRVTYLGVDLVDPQVSFSVWQYREAVIAQLAERPSEQDVIVVGGSGLYIKALIVGLDAPGGATPASRQCWEAQFAAQGVAGLQAALAARDPEGFKTIADPQNPRRLIRALERLAAGALPGGSGGGRATACEQPVIAGLRMDPVLLWRRIEQRVEAMYAAGLLDEVAGLLEHGLSPTARQAIGYAEAIAVIEGRCSRDEAMALTAARTRRLAKRQRTWFRHQANVAWFDVAEGDSVESLSARVQEQWRRHGSASLV